MYRRPKRIDAVNLSAGMGSCRRMFSSKFCSDEKEWIEAKLLLSSPAKGALGPRPKLEKGE